MSLNVPSRHNEKLSQLLVRINEDLELQQLWKCANINAVDRSGISDHGEVHIQIAANAALKMLRLLADADVETSVVKDHGLTYEDAEVIVVLAACLHDVGMAVHRDNHEQYSLMLAAPKARELLIELYEEPERTIMVSEVLHAVIAHHWDTPCNTIEAGILKVADALDLTQGRSRIPFEAGLTNIHSVSAMAIDSVALEKGETVPIRVVITMSNSAGIFQVDELLKRKLQHSTIAPYVQVVARIEGETEKRLVEFYSIAQEPQREEVVI
jgi:metal-dependent HD superfamily phosphatase/phosphodiesterase